MIGMAIAKGLEERGQVGATHMGTSFDAWYPGYVDYAPIFKNIPAFWTETAGNMAAPREYSINDIPQNFRDLRPQSLYSSPWPGGWWRLGDAVAYNETAALAVLEYAAKYKQSLLYNRYQAGRDQIARGRKDAPYAYFIPQDQRDPVAAVELLRRLAFAGVRVLQLTAPVTLDKTDVSGGHVGGPDRPGVRCDGAHGAQRPEVSGPAPVPGRPAAAALRRRRLDAAAADGGQVDGRCHAAHGRYARQDEIAGSDAGSEDPSDSVQPDGSGRPCALRQRPRHRLRLESRPPLP